MDTPPQLMVKRSGQPPVSKNHNPSVALIKKNAKPLRPIPDRTRSPSPPSFTVYKCRWRGCSAQLHNIATLRRHISKKHKPSKETVIEGGYICWWRKCIYLESDKEGSFIATQSFDSPEEWLEHIDDVHLHGLAMKYGDGPAITHIGKPKLDFNISKVLYDPSTSPATRTLPCIDPQSIALDKAKYLSDEKGKVTTAAAPPTASDEYPSDVLTLTSVNADDFMHVKGFEAAHRHPKDGESKSRLIDIRKAAEDMLQAMEVRKEKAGPGIDRGGCILVNEARRSTLVQNADIARVVDDDY